MTKFTITLLAVALFAATGLAKEPEKSDKKDESKAAETVQTPFGRVAKQAPPAKPAAGKKAPSMVQVKADGDVLRFSRKTPFGSQSWTRSKSELSSNEKEWAKEAGVALDAAPAKAAKAAPQP